MQNEFLPPKNWDIAVVLDALERTLMTYYRDRPPYPDAFQTIFLTKEHARQQGEDALWRLLQLTTQTAYALGLQWLPDQSEFVEALTEARRMLLVGGVQIEGADYSQDLRNQSKE